MKKLLIPLAGVALLTGVALATPAPKVFVCKYVGTPNVNESLQTGQNPISVSSNAIKNYQGVGSYFNDAQGRSLVVAEDTGQPDPTCPTPQNPPVTTPTPPTGTTTTPSTSTEVTPTVLPDVGGHGKE